MFMIIVSKIYYFYWFHFLSFFYLVVNSSRYAGPSQFLDTCIGKINVTIKDEECENCNASSPYRTITGCCNNLERTDQGRSNVKLERLMENAYEDGVSLPRGGLDNSSLPSARTVSTTVHGVGETGARPGVSVMLMQFGQFLDHDLSLTPEQG